MKCSFLNKVEKIEDDLYVITEAGSVHCYLIIGSEKAIIFDIGYGYENIMPIVRDITELPVELVLSHGDPDHGLGCSHFDNVWIHELDWGKLLRSDSADIRQKAVDYRLYKMPEAAEFINRDEFIATRIGRETTPNFLRDGDLINLGDRSLTVIHTPGHSYGHIMLLDSKKKRLFSGDQVSAHNIWYFLSSDEQAPFTSALKSLYKILDLKSEVESIYPAHNVYPLAINYVEDQIECLEHELPDNYLNDTKFESFMGNGYQHYYKTVNLIYSDERLGEYLGKSIER